LSQDASVNFYMSFGGTNFGFLNGANYADDAPYRPDTTSYDYLAAIDEAGRPRNKFYRFRDIIARYRSVQPPDVPPIPQTIAIPEFALAERADARTLLSEPVLSENPLTMEAIEQNFGYVLYRAELQSPIDGMLTVEDVRDYAVVTVNGSLAGHLDRRSGETAVPLRALTGKVVLEILVENSGRINYGAGFADERKGICGPVRLDGQKVTVWECHAMPMDDLTPLRFAGGNAGPMAFARGFFELNAPADTFLDVSALGKGMLWINGHHLGRFWRIGPQQSLYVPGVWLRHGRNEVIAFDLEQLESPRLRGLAEPIYSEVHVEGAGS
ncbi:MAG: beta-galactosidase, partial [Candidatus Eremiobacteraeota bacterium]|nr:beta-galactosidase [Candidatus Eremiobacteraeota bacterium]